METHAHPEEATQERANAEVGLASCIQSCLAATRAAQQARAHVAGIGGRLADRQLLSLLLDCAEACELAARWMQRESVFHADLCAVCATICKSCEEACSRSGEATLQACAEACRRCFDTCLRMGQKEPMLTH
jgi:hypothetical protein